MLQSKYPENFICESLPNCCDSIEIKYHYFKQLNSCENSLCLRSGYELIVSVLRKLYRDDRLIKAIVVA